MINIYPIGAKVLVEEISKPNEEGKTGTGIIITEKSKDSHDTAMLKGLVIGMGESEIDIHGIERKVNFKVGEVIYFNRYECYIVGNKGITKYWLVSCKDIWAKEE